ncbi:MAG: hypothetical protein QOF55_2407 [Thermoleophilaceae bacterium]|jgi:hypothetical protein|nr:hypothetical protein [Thermoleophilaceae bacterium]
MEYMLLIYAEGEPGAGTEEEREQMGAAFAKYSQDLAEAGAIVGGDPLQPPTSATTVRAQGGETTTTDGPFAETKEWLAGYYKIEVESLDEAIEWAGRIPSVAYGGSVEVRPLAPMPTGQPSST